MMVIIYANDITILLTVTDGMLSLIKLREGRKI